MSSGTWDIAVRRGKMEEQECPSCKTCFGNDPYNFIIPMNRDQGAELLSSHESVSRSTLLNLLRIIILLQSIGIAGKYLFVKFESDSNVYELLFFDWRWPEPVAQLIDDGVAWVCLVAACCIFTAGFARCLPAADMKKMLAPIRFVEIVSVWLIVAWMFILALTDMIRGGLFAELSLGEHAVRFCLPLFFWMVLMSESTPHEVSTDQIAADRYSNVSIRGRRSGWLMWGIFILSLATAATFAVHGHKALSCYGHFVDLILLSDAQWLGVEPTQATVERWLIFIGIVDLVVSGLLVFTRWRVVAAYMVLWALVTAASRITAFGFAAWPEALIRSANWGAPLVLWWCFQNNRRTNQSRAQTGNDAGHIVATFASTPPLANISTN